MHAKSTKIGFKWEMKIFTGGVTKKKEKKTEIIIIILRGIKKIMKTEKKKLGIWKMENVVADMK